MKENQLVNISKTFAADRYIPVNRQAFDVISVASSHIAGFCPISRSRDCTIYETGGSHKNEKNKN